MARVLIADDDHDVLELLNDIVEAFGHETCACTCGEEAWEHLKGPSQFDLVLSDVNMPGISGLALTTRILDDPQLCTIPIVLISGVVTVNEISRVLSLGKNVRFLGKPIRLLDLQNVFDEVFTRCESKRGQ